MDGEPDKAQYRLTKSKPTFRQPDFWRQKLHTERSDAC
jgi:hypothetical protein